MAEQTETKKKDTSQIDNFLMFQKLMGEQIKQKMSLDPYLKGASSALKKMGEKDITESAMQIGSDKTAEQFNQMVLGNTTPQGIQSGQSQGTDLLGQLVNQPQAQKSQQGQQGFNPVNMLEQLISLGGLIKPTPQNQLALAQTQALQQKMVGEEPLQKGEREKIGIEKNLGFAQDIQKLQFEYDLKLRNEIQKPDSKANEAIASANVFRDDFMNYIQSFENISMKGGKGKAALGATGAFFAPGIGKEGGREQRAEADTLGEVLAYNLAATKAKQEGRALDKAELERFRKLSKMSTTDTEGQKIGKLNAIIKLYNTSASQVGAEPLADARTILQSVKGRANQQTQPGLLDAIQAEKKRRGLK